jgi:uncharacterized protein YbjT (DUF2867 family)
MRRVLVTGANGRIGSRLVPQLAARNDVVVTALVRDAGRAALLEASGAGLARGTFEDARSLHGALEDVDTAVLITPASPDAADQAIAFLAAAKESGVRKIVRVSVFKAALDGPTDAVRLHGRSDGALLASGLRYVILRPTFFMQNLLFVAARTIASEGRIYFGVGDASLGMIDLRDIVDCAEQGVVSDAMDDEIVALTGPERITFREVADRLADVLGRPVEYVPVPPETVERTVRASGMGEWYARVMRDVCRSYSEGWGDLTTDGVLGMTGRAPRTIEAFAREIFAPALEGARRTGS